MRTHDSAGGSDTFTLARVERRDVEELFKIVGRAHIELRNAAGELVDERHVENLITTVGKGGIVDRLLAAPTIAAPTHMAVGTGATAEVVGNTALQTETARVALTSKSRSGNVLTMVGDYAAGVATAALTEAGVLNAASVGDLFSRVTFAVINKGATDTLKITWTYTIG